METLSDNNGKLVFLQADKTLNFHAPYGTHYNIRIPKFGRDIDEIYRLNLKSGQFKEPFQTNMTDCNKIQLTPCIRWFAVVGRDCNVNSGIPDQGRRCLRLSC